MRDDGPTYDVLKVWKMGYTGRGVVVGVVDDGLQKDHPEIKDNYVSTYSTLTKLTCMSFPASLQYLLPFFSPSFPPFFSSKLYMQESSLHCYDLTRH